ncbi:13266_t:CDS:1 [Ambispora leptoticha]|uniref:13266_t:CDS:1 n=1 Tax=Ambispora leptoticha TaxID=144679 RepID=A0A9N9H714_9GLOM|nr:13266_t:CDS:1 [Ambispora leptoticha]
MRKLSKSVKMEPHYCSFHTKPQKSITPIRKIAKFLASISPNRKNKLRARGVGPQKFIIPTIIVTCDDDDDSDSDASSTDTRIVGKVVFVGDEGMLGSRYVVINKPSSYNETILLSNYNSQVVVS